MTLKEYLSSIVFKFTPTDDKIKATLCLNKIYGEATENIDDILEQLIM